MKEISQYKTIVEGCEKLRNLIKVDFVGFAIQDQLSPDVKWYFAAGNLNDKYKRITVRYGKGIAGRVISTGTPMTVNDFPNQILGKAAEYPIMLAEKLVSSFAVPILYKGVPKGVLLIGVRNTHTFTDSDRILVQNTANDMEKMLLSLIES